MSFAAKIDRLKKKYDIKDYKEIVYCMESGKKIDNYKRNNVIEI